MQITWAYTNGETLTNFPALVVLGTNRVNFDYSTFESPADAGDLRFATDDLLTELQYEIEAWDTAGVSYVWVQIPLFTNSTSIWAMWGNDHETIPPAYRTNGAAWSAAYAGVWHMSELDARDSTANGNHGTASGNVTNHSAGRVGRANNFIPGGNGNWIEVADANSLDIVQYITLSAWVRPEVIPTDNSAVIFKQLDWYDYDASYALDSDNGYGGEARFWLYRGGDSWDEIIDAVPISALQWHHLAGTFDGAVMRLYVDGVQKNQLGRTLAIPSNTRPLRFGWSWNHSWDGLIDEARIESVARSSNWVWTSYMNEGSHETFATYGPVGFYPRGTLLEIR